MRQSELISQTRRDCPRQVQSQGQALMIRAGFIEQVGPGLWAYMPLLVRLMDKLSKLIGARLEGSGYQRISLPALQSTSGKLERDGLSVEDGRFLLSRHYLDALQGIVCSQIHSYRDLPRLVYLLQSGFSKTSTAWSGLLDAKESLVIEAFGLGHDQAGIDQTHDQMLELFGRLFDLVGIVYGRFEIDPGNQQAATAFVAGLDGGDPYLRCPGCGYSASQHYAESRLPQFPQDQQPLPKTDVFGEGLISTEAVAGFLGIPVWKTTKTILFEADGRPVAVMVRGDCDISQTKLQRVLGCKQLGLLPAWQVQQITGAEVGYAGPIGLPPEVLLIADHYVGGRVNFECGANRTNYHSINVNFGRDLPLPRFEDLKLARPGDGCPRCDGVLELFSGLGFGELARFGPLPGCQYADHQGLQRPVYLARFWLDLTRLVGILAEQRRCSNGLCWPVQIAPYQVHIIGLNLEEEQIRDLCLKAYKALQSQGLDVLYDDRPLRAGQKFADSDLIGLPIRLTIGKKALAQGGLELFFRQSGQVQVLSLEKAIASINEWISNQMAFM